MLTVKYIKKDNSKVVISQRLDVVCDEDGTEKKVGFTIKDIDEGHRDNIYELFGKNLKGNTYSSKGEVLEEGWKIIFDYKNEKNINISLFEYNRTLPPEIVKVRKFSVSRDKDDILILRGYLVQNDETKPFNISLSVKKIKADSLRQILDGVEGYACTCQFQTFEQARKELRHAVRDLQYGLGIITEDALDAALTGTKGDYMKIILGRLRSQGSRDR